MTQDYSRTDTDLKSTGNCFVKSQEKCGTNAEKPGKMFPVLRAFNV
jgi:hypothetical protein